MDVELRIEDVPGLSNRIRAVRKARGLSLQEVAAKLGVEHTTISRLERGEMKITGEYLASLSAALECSPVELIADLGDVARNDREREALELMRSMEPQAAAAWLATGGFVRKKG